MSGDRRALEHLANMLRQFASELDDRARRYSDAEVTRVCDFLEEPINALANALDKYDASISN